MVTLPRECPICLQRRRQNSEDVLPIWLRKLLLELGAYTKEQAPPRTKLSVCHLCNSRMGAVFEDPAAKILPSLIRDQAVALTPGQQQLVAGWVLKTFVLMVLHNERRGAGPAGVVGRERLRSILAAMLENGGMPLEGVAVHLAGRTGLDGLPSEVSKRPPYPDPWPSPNALTFVDLGGQGPLMWRTVIGEVADVEKFIDHAEGDDWFVRIWPRQERAINWPPPKLLSRLDIRLQCVAWGLRNPRDLLPQSQRLRPKA